MDETILENINLKDCENDKLEKVNSNKTITKNSYKLKTKIVLKLIVVFACAILGVGFISGSEIYEFFVRFKNYLPLTIGLFFVLIFILTRKVFLQNNNYQKTLKMQNMTKVSNKNTFLLKFKIKKVLLFFNCFAVSSAMFSGLNVLCKKLFFNNYYLPILITLVLVFFILLIGLKGLSKIDYLVVVFLMFIITIFCIELKSNSFDEVVMLSSISLSEFSLGSFLGALFFAVNYVFMNIIQIQPVLGEFNIVAGKKQINIISFLFAFLLTFVLAIFSIFLLNNMSYANFSMPFLEFFSQKSKLIYFIYVVGLILALVSSLIGCLFGVKREIMNYAKTNLFATIASVFATFVFGFIDFKVFVTVIYPIVGVINFIIFVFL